MGTKCKQQFALFMEIVNNILESILKYRFLFQTGFLLWDKRKSFSFIEDKAYYRHIFAFSVIRNMV